MTQMNYTASPKAQIAKNDHAVRHMPMAQLTLERHHKHATVPASLASYIREVFSKLSADPDNQALEQLLLKLFRSARSAIAEECRITKDGILEVTELRIRAREMLERGQLRMAEKIRGQVEAAEARAESTNGQLFRETFAESLKRYPHLKPQLCEKFRRITADTLQG